ncbi:MAG: hypothetical protein J0H94_06560, partial [Rhizobiales bacterium]|nr:hypothetical protein [Hyphomicrobiales bacterium]
MRMAWIVRLSLLVTATLALATPTALAGYNFPVWGGRGDAAYADRCPPNQYLIGVKSKTGAWFDALAIICAPVQQGVVFDPKTYGQMNGGGGGGGPLDYVCNNDEVITGIAPAFMHDGDQLKQLADLIITCTSKRSGASKKLRIIGNHLSDEVFTQYPGHQFCGDGQVAVGFNLRYGVHVNAIGLMCDTYVPPPPPPVVAQAPPPKPIKTTGKAKGSASGPSAPPGLLVCRFGPTMKPFGNVS